MEKRCNIIKIGEFVYVTSNDEIKDKEYYISNNKVYQFLNSGYNGINFKKIIASTNPELHKDGVAKIGLPFIEKYITEYNKLTPITTVLIEYEELYLYPDGNLSKVSRLAPNAIPIDKVKLRSDGTVIIHNTQELFSRKEMEKAYKAGEHRGLFIDEPDETAFRTFGEWFEQNY